MYVSQKRQYHDHFLWTSDHLSQMQGLGGHCWVSINRIRQITRSRDIAKQTQIVWYINLLVTKAVDWLISALINYQYSIEPIKGGVWNKTIHRWGHDLGGNVHKQGATMASVLHEWTPCVTFVPKGDPPVYFGECFKGMCTLMPSSNSCEN